MKQPIIETERFLIREITLEDVEGMFELDSNPNVQRYVGNSPVTSRAEVIKTIESIRNQYKANGIARWAVIEKKTQQFVGWTGFKLNTEYEMNGMKDVFDLGYRFIESHWGKGYATETALACLDYAFKHLPFDPIYGGAEIGNHASNHILKKVGMKYVNQFDFDGDPHYFYSITKEDWLARNS